MFFVYLLNMDFTRCVICEELNIFRRKIKCPKGTNKFCKTCIKNHLQNLIDSGDTSGIVLCPCGCDKSLNIGILLYQSKSIGKLYCEFMSKNKEFVDEKNIENRQNEIDMEHNIFSNNCTNEEEIVHFINNSVLTTKCPLCGIAYDGFDGCCALTCSTCGTYFCAYCRIQNMTNHENHAHVLICTFNENNKGNYFANRNENVNKKYCELIFTFLITHYSQYITIICETFGKEYIEEFEKKYKINIDNLYLIKKENDNVKANDNVKYIEKVFSYGIPITIGFAIGIFITKKLFYD